MVVTLTLSATVPVLLRQTEHPAGGNQIAIMSATIIILQAMKHKL